MLDISKLLPHAVSRQKGQTRMLLSLACVGAMLIPSVSHGATLGTERLVEEDQKYLGEAMSKGGSDLEDAIAQVYSNFVASLVGFVSGVQPDATENAAAAAGQILPGMSGAAQDDGSRLTPSDRAMIREASQRSVGDLEVAVQRVIFNQAISVVGYVANARPDLADDVAFASTRAMPGSFRNVVYVLNTDSVGNTEPSEASSGAVRLSAARGVATAVSFEGVSEQRKIILADIIEDVGSVEVATVSRTAQPEAPTEQASAVERLRTARGETGTVASIAPLDDGSGNALTTGTNDSILGASTNGDDAASSLFAQAGIDESTSSLASCNISGPTLGTSDRARLRNAASQGGDALSNEVRSAIQDRSLPAARVVSFLVSESPGSLNRVLRAGVRANPDEASSMVCAAAESAKDVNPAVVVVIANDAGAENIPALIVAAARGSGTSIRSVLTTVSRVANLRGNALANVVARLVDMGHGRGGSSGDGDSPGSLGNPLITPTVVAAVAASTVASTVGVNLTISYTSPN